MAETLSEATVDRREHTGIEYTSWLPAFLFAIALVAEILSLLLMTIYRYQQQSLSPQFFDLSKTANLLGFLFEAPFLALFLMLMLMKRYHSMRLAGTAAAMASGGLVVLSAAPMISSLDPTTVPYAGYLLFLVVKVVELAVFVVALGPPRKSFWHRLAGVTIFALLLMVGGVAGVIASVLISPIGATILEQPTQEYDAGVILGAAVWSGNRPSPVFRERINKGFDLLSNGTVQFLVLTGGKAPNELPEAEVGRRELIRRGVDPTRIVLETHTSSTREQIIFIRDQLLKKQGWNTFIIISDQFHLKRALEICEFNEIDARGVSSESPLGPQNVALYQLRESAALIYYWLFGI